MDVSPKTIETDAEHEITAELTWFQKHMGAAIGAIAVASGIAGALLAIIF